MNADKKECPFIRTSGYLNYLGIKQKSNLKLSKKLKNLKNNICAIK